MAGVGLTLSVNTLGQEQMIANAFRNTTRRLAIRRTACLTAAIPTMVAADRTQLVRLMVTTSVNANAIYITTRQATTTMTAPQSTIVCLLTADVTKIVFMTGQAYLIAPVALALFMTVQPV